MQAIQVLELPYVDNSLAETPDLNDVIWRFMDFPKFFSTVCNQALYFPVVSALNDVLESAPPRLPKDATVHAKMSAWSRWQRQRHMVFVNCWHWSPVESAAMWALYSRHGEGLAIQSTFGAATQAFGSHVNSTPHTVQAGMVKYINSDAESTPGQTSNIILDALKKRDWYEYEKELRFMHVAMDNYVEQPFGSEVDPGTAQKRGIWIKCRLQTLIKSVVLAPSAPPFLADVIRQICQQFGLDPSLQRCSRLCEGAPAPPDLIAWRDYVKELQKAHGPSWVLL